MVPSTSPSRSVSAHNIKTTPSHIIYIISPDYGRVTFEDPNISQS